MLSHKKITMEVIMAQNDNQTTKKLPGFYIALCCCVLAIGVAGFFSDKSSVTKNTDEEYVASVESFPQDSNATDTNEDVSPVNDTVVIEDVLEEYIPTAPPKDVIEENAEIDYSIKTSADYTYNNPDVEETAIIVNAEEPYFNMPAGGEILEGFSSTLSYNEAMGDWRTHNGIDIAADIGCSISACADGTVADVFSDAYGNGITLKHENGFITKYMCLGSIEDIKVGDSVKAGDIIGTVGEAKGENIKESHLHFEMYDGDILLNPTQYLN